MKRETSTHDAIFTDEAFAEKYARGHRQMAEKFGQEYSRKLTRHGFTHGKILDAGCGFGATLLVLAKAFPESECLGIDLSDPLLILARKSAEEAGLANRVRFEKADVLEIPYNDDNFDVVINANMVHLVKDPIKMLNELERVLAPHGFLFIADLRRSWLGWIEREIRSSFSLEEARQLFTQANLRPGRLSSDLLWWRYETLKEG